jgi:hypothetical protein
MSDRWQSLIDKQLQTLIESGEMADLPGVGKPLNLDTDRHTPEELRLAHKILRDNNLAPEWITLGRELDMKRAELLSDIRKGVQNYRAAQSADTLSRRRAENAWHRVQQHYHDAAQVLNKQITGYNLKIPPGIAQKSHVNVHREIERLLV